jgi:putative ABC transport system permease protein
VLADIWAIKTRTVLVVLSIAVGVFAVGMIAGTQAVIMRDLPAAYLSINPASATLHTDGADEDLIHSVRRMKGVREAEGRQSTRVRARVEAKDWHSLQLVAVDDFEDIRINQIRPESGAWPPARREVLVERNSLEFLQARVGDLLVVETADGKQYELRVAGLAHDLESCPPFMCGEGLGYVTFDTMEWLGAPLSFNKVSIIVAENALDKAHVEAVAKDVQTKMEKSGLTVSRIWVPEPGKHEADSFLQTFVSVLGVLGLLALVLSGFLVVNTISGLLMQQVRQIGMMKAVGARRNQIVGMYLATVLIFGLLALLVGVPLGVIGAYGFSSYLVNALNFDAATLFPPLYVFVMQVAVGLMVPVLAALYPVIGGTRITVREALSSYHVSKGKSEQSRLDRLLGRVAILSRPLLLSLRNTFRRKGRLALTLITLTLGGGVFMAVLTVRDSTVLTLDDALGYWNYDLAVDLRRPYRSDQIENEALSVPGVAQVESVTGTSVLRIRPDGNEGNNFFMQALPAQTEMIQPIVLQGRWLLPDDENAVVLNSNVVKDEPDIKVGDEILLKVDGRESTWRVVGIVRGVLTGPIVYANQPYYEQVVRRVGIASSLWVVTREHDAASRTEVMEALRSRFKNAGMPVRSIEAMVDVRARVQSNFDILVVFLLIMAVLLAVVGGLGLMGTMSLNVIERTREIGIMRAIGASDGAVRRIVIVEAILIGLFSWFVGAIIALPISMALSDVVGMIFMQAPLSYSFSIGGVLAWLIAVIFISALSSLLPARRASRLSVREVLAYE